MIAGEGECRRRGGVRVEMFDDEQKSRSRLVTSSRGFQSRPSQNWWDAD
jgi:hypothetical protein